MRPERIHRRLLPGVLAPTLLAATLSIACYQIAGYDEFSFQQPLGAACMRAEQCASGFCADGVCCNSACDQLCESCNAGVCTPAAANTDPDNDCSADPSNCKQEQCNGSAGDNACNVPEETVCATAECVTDPDGDYEITAASCGALGGCPSQTNACGQYRCGSQACHDNCSSVSECVPKSVCTEGFRCQPLAKQISAGALHSCVLLEGRDDSIDDDTIKCWGHNDDGQLGSGISIDSSNTPLAVVQGSAPLIGITAISSGDSHSCGLLSSGSMRCWGLNSSGQLGDDGMSIGAVPVAVSGLSNAQQIASGRSHTCALLSDDTARCWGNNAQGQLGTGDFDDRAAPGTAVQGLADIAAIASGDSFSCARLNSGQVYCWGSNQWGQLGSNNGMDSNTPVAVPGLTGATDLSCGNSHSCAVVADGSVWCWGRNQYGQLGDGTGDGTDDHNSATPVQVMDAMAIAQLSLGGNHSCAVSSGGAALCWGYNNHGQLGYETDNELSNVALPSVNANSRTISAGGNHTCLLLNSGTSLCWGNNAFGQLGTGDNTPHSTPTEVIY